MAKFSKGDRVTCRRRVEASYSNYGGRPECYLEPGDVATIVNGKWLPSVRRARVDFIRVEFTKHGQQWEAALTRDNIAKA